MTSDMEPSLKDMKSYSMLLPSVIFLVLSAIALALRIYVRAFMIRSVGWSDWLMVLTWMCYAALCGLLMEISLLEITEGVSDPDVVSSILTLVVCIFGLYILCTILFKLSLAMFFLRLVSRKWQRHVILTSVSVYTLFGTAWLFIALFQCGNPALYLENEQAGKCLDFKTVLRPLNYTHGALNAITDWIFVCIPIIVVRSAQIPRKAKITVCAILVLGVLGSVCSVVRLAYVDVIGVPLDRMLVVSPNYAIVSVIELGLGLTSANLATLRPLFSSCLEKARSGIGSSRSRGTKTAPGRHVYGVSGKHVSHTTCSTGDTDQSESGVVMVTTELRVYANKPGLEDVVELYELPGSQDDVPSGSRSDIRRKISQSSVASLLQDA